MVRLSDVTHAADGERSTEIGDKDVTRMADTDAELAVMCLLVKIAPFVATARRYVGRAGGRPGRALVVKTAKVVVASLPHAAGASNEGLHAFN